MNFVKNKEKNPQRLCVTRSRNSVHLTLMVMWHMLTPRDMIDVHSNSLCTLKNELASDCDDIGVQLSMGRRTLLAATRRLIDGVPSENTRAVSKHVY